MEKKGVVTLAQALKALVTVTFICNLILLPLMPLLIWAGQTSSTMLERFFAEVTLARFVGAGLRALITVWLSSYTAMLAAFLMVCGVCTAIILWQARRVLKTIVAQNTFVMGNAKNMMRAAVCCFLISGAALVRTVWGFFFYRSITPLFTYNALFVPIFLMGGLLCMVMSALFRQAAELKEENDLTI